MRRSKRSNSDPEPDLSSMLRQICREHGVEQDALVATVEKVLRTAAAGYFGTREELVSKYDSYKGNFEIASRKTVVAEPRNRDREISLEEARTLRPEAVVGEVVEVPKDTRAIGRMTVRAARQAVLDFLRDMETEKTRRQFQAKIGTLVTGTVTRFEGPDIMLDVGPLTACLPQREQSPIERYEIGDHVRAIVVEAGRSGRGLQVVVSRVNAALLNALLEAEVPEIRDGLVTIKGVVREAGERSKVAVQGTMKGIDPVGACIGIKGTRIGAVMRELRGERLDLVEWSEDPVTYVKRALSPAKPVHATVLPGPRKSVEVAIPPKQLSLAIGRRGQNVRLASKLTGWHVEIKGDTGRPAGGRDRSPDRRAERGAAGASRTTRSDSTPRSPRTEG
ncbi:MAG: transcription termination factor NusA [Acidobacteriota bacterium]